MADAQAPAQVPPASNNNNQQEIPAIPPDIANYIKMCLNGFRETFMGDVMAVVQDMINPMQLQLAQLHTARQQFIATASHELRTPIFSLGGFLELLADEELDEATRRDFIEQVRGQVDRLRKLTTELLDLSKLDSGSLQLHPEPTDLAALAREVTWSTCRTPLSRLP